MRLSPLRFVGKTFVKYRNELKKNLTFIKTVQIPLFFSISYRFILSSLLILMIAKIRGDKLFDKSLLWLIFFQGMVMFPLNYYLTYSACQYSPSGLVGLISSMAVLPAYGVGVILKKYPLSLKILGAIGVSLLGLAFLFRKEISGYTHNNIGLLLSMLSDLAAVLGITLVPILKKRAKVSLLSITRQSMLIGGIVSFFIGFSQHHTLIYTLETNYLVSLLILSFLTPLVFISFYYFSHKKGAVFASYVWVIAPIFSILMSFLFKEYRPGLLDGVGIFLILLSCLYVNRQVSVLSGEKERRFRLFPTRAEKGYAS